MLGSSHSHLSTKSMQGWRMLFVKTELGAMVVLLAAVALTYK